MDLSHYCYADFNRIMDINKQLRAKLKALAEIRMREITKNQSTANGTNEGLLRWTRSAKV
ncbi:MAG: hypothetical protein ACR5K4_03040 [Sodalis sp. (in: enterobacteria)]